MAFFSRLTADQQQNIISFIDDTFSAQTAALQGLIRIPSVKAPPEGNMPFGTDIQKALDAALALARKLGFSTKDIDGFAGVAEAGQGDETLGILAHLDVVPAGEGWSLPPFSGGLLDGNIYGRGATDDKGPAVSALYALAAVRAADIPLKRRVQIIFGCDEESGWACMEHYGKTQRMPDLAFSPDAEYPLVYSERAILHATYQLKLSGSRVHAKSGERPNVVPGTAEAFVHCAVSSLPQREGFTITAREAADGTNITVTGLGSHAAMPHRGRNALLFLLQALKALPLDTRDAEIALALANAFSMDLHGESLGLDIEDDSGRLTLSPDILRWDADGVSLTFDARIPHVLTPEDLLKRVSVALAPAGFSLVPNPRITRGHIVPRESELVQKLMGVYRAQTGDTAAQPLAIGGGTYARAIENAVAFGCEWPHREMLAHMPDECIPLEDMQKSTLMLADAIIALAGEGQG